MRLTNLPRILATGAITLASATAGAADPVSSFQGHFALDNELAVFGFDLAAAGDIMAATFGHSGGTNHAGATIAAGGFAPVLSLFDATGALVFGDTGSSHACVGAGSFCWDAQLNYLGAAAGHYTLVLSQDDNLPGATLAEAYSRAAEPHFTAMYLGQPGATTLQFVRVDGDQRTGGWALDVGVAAAVTQVPEPAAAWLLLGGLGTAAWWWRRRSV